MSFYDPIRVAPEIATVPMHDEAAPCIGHRRLLLLEAGLNDCCPDGDLLSLMPSVDDPDVPWVDGRTWLRRILGV